MKTFPLWMLAGAIFFGSGSAGAQNLNPDHLRQMCQMGTQLADSIARTLFEFSECATLDESRLSVGVGRNLENILDEAARQVHTVLQTASHLGHNGIVIAQYIQDFSDCFVNRSRSRGISRAMEIPVQSRQWTRNSVPNFLNTLRRNILARNGRFIGQIFETQSPDHLDCSQVRTLVGISQASVATEAPSIGGENIEWNLQGVEQSILNGVGLTPLNRAQPSRCTLDQWRAYVYEVRDRNPSFGTRAENWVLRPLGLLATGGVIYGLAVAGAPIVAGGAGLAEGAAATLVSSHGLEVTAGAVHLSRGVRALQGASALRPGFAGAISGVGIMASVSASGAAVARPVPAVTRVLLPVVTGQSGQNNATFGQCWVTRAEWTRAFE